MDQFKYNQILFNIDKEFETNHKEVSFIAAYVVSTTTGKKRYRAFQKVQNNFMPLNMDYLKDLENEGVFTDFTNYILPKLLLKENNMDKIKILEDQIVELKHQLCILQLNGIIEECTSIQKYYKKKLKEGFMDDHNGPLERDIDRATNLLLVANKALGYANKLKNTDQKRAHQSRVMKHINRIAKELFELTKRLPQGSPYSQGISYEA